MIDFVLLVKDDRYSVPNLRMLQAASEARARQLAQRVLEESAHHLSVEVWQADRRIVVVAQHGAET
ncbi:MAG: hypothetical protein JO127_01805 [Caulobacteraceae bacterium]|nr:hypothetical protein [Caulobacteraceae bacterium]